MPRHVGTGVLLQYAGQEYMATALHVAESCDFNPLIEYGGEWRPSTWKLIGTDEENDAAVLQRVGVEDARITTLEAMYGKGGSVFGAQAAALGFPDTVDGINWKRFRCSLRPLPMTVPVSLYFSTGETHYSGGYVNHGFSGGAIVAWNGTQPTIVGIITKKTRVYRTDGFIEHAGLVGFADIAVVERILARHATHDMREVRWNKPTPTDNLQKPQPPSLFTGEIMDAVIMLGHE